MLARDASAHVRADGDLRTDMCAVERARVCVVDWPWKFGDALPGSTRGASKQYACMDADGAAFALPPMLPDSLLLLWRVAAMQQEALSLAASWGYVVKSEIVWRKLTKNGKPHFGMGHYVRATHETCLVCTRGRFKVDSRSERSMFDAPMPVDDRGRIIHSAKPDEFFAFVQRLARGPYVELFARKRRAGWMQHGDQLPPAQESA